MEKSMHISPKTWKIHAKHMQHKCDTAHEQNTTHGKQHTKQTGKQKDCQLPKCKMRHVYKARSLQYT